MKNACLSMDFIPVGGKFDQFVPTSTPQLLKQRIMFVWIMIKYIWYPLLMKTKTSFNSAMAKLSANGLVGTGFASQ